MSLVDGSTLAPVVHQPIARMALTVVALPLGLGLAAAAGLTVLLPGTPATGLGLVALSAVLALWQIDRRVLAPIRAVAGELALLAGGRAPTTGLDARPDEIGAIASAAVTLNRQRLEALEAAKDAEQGRASADAERQMAQAAGRGGRVVHAEAIQALGEALDNLARGDLTHRITADFPEVYQKLRDDLNRASEVLETAMSQISANAEAVRSAATDIATASDDLSRRTESQAASLEQTAAAIEQITSTTRSTADNASRAREVVARAKAEAESGGDVVRQAIRAMSNIEASSEKISQIIGLIDEISFQTNLLALNAGVEAARAGEAGRGFAVVASEVRALAQRSADAAKEIKTLIMSSKQEVEKGVELVGGTGAALERIIASVAEINGAVGEIATSASEQATGLQEVNGAVSQMDQITQQNAAMVEKATIAVRALSAQTEEFARLVGRFEVTRRSGTSPSRAQVSPATAALPSSARQVDTHHAPHARHLSPAPMPKSATPASTPKPAAAPATAPKPAHRPAAAPPKHGEVHSLLAARKSSKAEARLGAKTGTRATVTAHPSAAKPIKLAAPLSKATHHAPPTPVQATPTPSPKPQPSMQPGDAARRPRRAASGAGGAAVARQDHGGWEEF